MNTPATCWEDVYRTQTARITELERENAALRKALSDADIVAEYEGEDGRRDWWGSGHWLHAGEVLVCMDRAAFDAARKEAQP